MTHKTRFGDITHSSFNPSSLLRNKHMQTIFPKYAIKAKKLPLVRERISTPDNDFIDVDWMLPNLPAPPRAIVVLFHGLEGSSQSHYIQHLLSELKQRNIAAVVMHFRGCSGESNLTTKAYHSGATFDPLFFIPLVKKRYPSLPLFTAGFSLGGNMLMKLLASDEYKAQTKTIRASVCVSAPLNLSASAKAINDGFARVYQAHLMKSMKRNLLEKMDKVDFSDTLKVSKTVIATMRTFREFDEHITAPLHGFLGADDYYSRCSAIYDLPKITTPTLIIHAADDPFMNKDVIPSKKLISPYLAYELNEYGGHVGFLTNLFGINKLWLPSRIGDFFEEQLC